MTRNLSSGSNSGRMTVNYMQQFVPMIGFHVMLLIYVANQCSTDLGRPLSHFCSFLFTLFIGKKLTQPFILCNDYS